MIIIASKEGQFANRVLHFAHILSFCKTHKITLWHPYFREYYSFFPNLHNEKSVRFPENNVFSALFLKVLILFVRVLLKLKIYNLGFLEVIFYERYEQDAPVYNLTKEGVATKAKKKVVVLWGWLFRDQDNFERQEVFLRTIFNVSEVYQQRAQNLMEQVKRDHDKVVGVHIRRGDYKRFENGRWFYEDDVYREKMLYVKDQLKQKYHNTAFLLCSNESLNIPLFKELDVYNFKEDFILDFLLLAACDYIIGPPSTFSALASYYGKVPLQFIPEKDSVPSLRQFSVCTRL